VLRWRTLVLWLPLFGHVLAAAQSVGRESIDLNVEPVHPILWAPLDDHAKDDTISNRVNPAESGHLLVVGRPAATEALSLTLALPADSRIAANRQVRCLWLPDGRTHVVLPIPRNFNPKEGTLDLLWQAGASMEEFGALFCSDADTAFQAFLAQGRLHFRVAGGQVSAAHRPQLGVWHRYRFLWSQPEGRRAIFIDGEPAVDKKQGVWQEALPGKTLLLNARANLAFPGRGGAPGFYADIVIYDRAVSEASPDSTEP
jgi:hypothetical protein